MDKEGQRAYNRAYYAQNRHKELERARRYRQENPDVISQASLRRRIKKLGVEGSHTVAQWHALCAEYDHRCLGCGGTDSALTRDHIIPLWLGGTDYIDNIQPLCLSCNSRKNTEVVSYREGHTVPDPQRITIQEAARRLGVKEDAIRKRIQRGSLRHEKTKEGRVFVWVDASQDTAQDASQATYQAVSQGALLAAKDETIAALREQLAQANERDRENRRIIAALTARIPAIEAPETVEEASEGAEPHPGTGEAQEGVQRPWWRRWFGS